MNGYELWMEKSKFRMLAMLDYNVLEAGGECCLLTTVKSPCKLFERIKYL